MIRFHWISNQKEVIEKREHRDRERERTGIDFTKSEVGNLFMKGPRKKGKRIQM